jgi:hypothetical protein
MRARRIVTVLSSLAVVAAGLTLTPPASADSVQVQSYQRSNAFAKKPVPTKPKPPSKPKPSASAKPKPAKPSKPKPAKSVVTDPSCATGGTCVLGDIGPGGGLVFLISGGLRYEMAPKTWSGASVDPLRAWCSNASTVPSGYKTAVGTGNANTTAMLTSAVPFIACTNSAPNAVREYAGTDASTGKWFLPSKDELNAMCNYSRHPIAPAAPIVSCYGSLGTEQDATFAAGAFGFANEDYWSSSQHLAVAGVVGGGWYQKFAYGNSDNGNESALLRIRAVRSF